MTPIQERAALEAARRLGLVGKELNEHGVIALCHGFLVQNEMIKIEAKMESSKEPMVLIPKAHEVQNIRNSEGISLMEAFRKAQNKLLMRKVKELDADDALKSVLLTIVARL